MRKLLVVVGVVAFSFGAVSCKKECKCTLAGVNFPTSGVFDSKDDCDAYVKLNEELGSPIKCEWK